MAKPRNMHTIDRGVRLVIGLLCVYIGLIDSSLIANRIVAVIVGIFGIVNIYAFFTARCPVYAATGFSTCTRPKPTPK